MLTKITSLCLFLLYTFGYGRVAADPWKHISSLDVNDTCKSALTYAKKPSKGDCQWPLKTFNNGAGLVKFCSSVQSCIDLSKKRVSGKCKDSIGKVEEVTFFLEYGIAIRYRSACIKDGQDRWCRTPVATDAQRCKDCATQIKQVITHATISAPKSLREDVTLKLDERVAKCDGSGVGINASSLVQSSLVATTVFLAAILAYGQCL
jgi:hypothetical protein